LAGIGLELTKILLQRPRTTVIATARSKATNLDDLHGVKPLMHSTAGLLVVQLEVSPDCDLAEANALNCLQKNYPLLTHIDVVIANAGIGREFNTVLTTPMSSMREDFEVNTLGMDEH
jgi:norsolorinic acid ketoreductase